MRKLVSIRKIQEIIPIEGADRIELARVDGWKTIVPKDKHKVGELVVYFEVDSHIPITLGPTSFLEARGRKVNGDGTDGYRIRTIKLKKVLSQGLILPISDFDFGREMIEGEDITDILNVKLYEPVEHSIIFGGQRKGNFPIFIRKTDQERIQNLPEFFLNYKYMSFEATQKIDGTSATYYLNNDIFGICSRNMEKKVDYENDNSVYTIVAKSMDIERVLRNIGKNIAIQGEIAGPGIQKNKEDLTKLRFLMFDVYDINTQCYLTPDERNDIFNMMLEHGIHICHVPIVDEAIKIFEICPTMEDILKYAEGKSVINTKQEREGVVFKSLIRVNGDTISFKVINNKYLLGEE